MQVCPLSNRQKKTKETITISLININIFPCKAKTNSVKQNVYDDPKDWYCIDRPPAFISSESHQLEEKWGWSVLSWGHRPSMTRQRLQGVWMLLLCLVWVIWRASGKVLNFSSSIVSRSILKPGDKVNKNIAGYRMELPFAPKGHIKRSFDPKLKLSKGPNRHWLKK